MSIFPAHKLLVQIEASGCIHGHKSIWEHGRTDDNIETIKKRFRVFVEQSMPVIDQYTSSGK
eukprot:scaffold189790_cov15-Tisochrysis_lutea.AAC.1